MNISIVIYFEPATGFRLVVHVQMREFNPRNYHVVMTVQVIQGNCHTLRNRYTQCLPE
jgi:hypothetical protein